MRKRSKRYPQSVEKPKWHGIERLNLVLGLVATVLTIILGVLTIKPCQSNAPQGTKTTVTTTTTTTTTSTEPIESAPSESLAMEVPHDVPIAGDTIIAANSQDHAPAQNRKKKTPNPKHENNRVPVLRQNLQDDIQAYVGSSLCSTRIIAFIDRITSAYKKSDSATLDDLFFGYGGNLKHVTVYSNLDYARQNRVNDDYLDRVLQSTQMGLKAYKKSTVHAGAVFRTKDIASTTINGARRTRIVVEIRPNSSAQTSDVQQWILILDCDLSDSATNIVVWFSGWLLTEDINEDIIYALAIK